MFDEISSTYDLLNNLLSFGLHREWRKRLLEYFPERGNLNLLDLATGTADVLITLCLGNNKITNAYGIDMADKMLEIGRKKVRQYGLHTKIKLQQGDINQTGFKDDSFDITTISFGIRNVTDPTKVLAEMHRVLKKEGRALILEFSLPKNSLLRGVHLFYLRNIVPLFGGLISGHPQAYRYLNQTVESFPYGDEFCRWMFEAGFKNVKAHPLLFGVASIYEGEKP